MGGMVETNEFFEIFDHFAGWRGGEVLADKVICL